MLLHVTSFNSITLLEVNITVNTQELFVLLLHLPPVSCLSSVPYSFVPSFPFTSHLVFKSFLLSLMLSSSPLSSLMETSFMADSKCIRGVPHSSVREISAERITLAFSTNAVLWLTFDGEISRGCKFNHSGSVCVCVCGHVCLRSVCLNANSGP